MGKEDDAIMTADFDELLPPRSQKVKLHWPTPSPHMLSGVLRNWLLGELQHPWTLETITVRIEKELTPGDAGSWPEFEILREQARLLGHHVKVRLEIRQNHC